MEGIWYVIELVGIILLLVILEKIVNRNAKKELISKLKESYGKINLNELTSEEMELIKYYYENISSDTDIDEITWNDLDMDIIFNRLNTTCSSIGSEYLYAMLKKIDFDKDSLEKKDSLSKGMSRNAFVRLKTQLILSNIGKNSKISIYKYMTRMNEVKSSKCIISKMQIFLLIVAIVGILLNSKVALAFTLFMIAVNVATYYVHRAKIEPYLSFFSYIVRLNKNIEYLCKLELEELKPYQIRLKELSKRLGKLRKGSFLLTTAKVSGSFIESLMDYIKMIFHVDIIKFYSMLEIIKKNQDNIKELYEIIGFIDSCIAIASYRDSLLYWSKPNLVDNKEIEYIVEDMYHPLIENPVANSISEKRSVLLTGSNASGKSTFIKTLAINSILSQTIYTSLSKSYKAPFYQIYSSMALRDSLLKGESYYMVEIKSLKRIITANHSNRPILCFVDEVLRGTNTLERISASAHILSYIANENAMCFAATHDIELTKILSDKYNNYHFQEYIIDNDVKFDYKLYQGEAKSRNAIKLLNMMGYSEDIVDKATNMAERFLHEGVWKL